MHATECCFCTVVQLKTEETNGKPLNERLLGLLPPNPRKSRERSSRSELKKQSNPETDMYSVFVHEKNSAFEADLPDIAKNY